MAAIDQVVKIDITNQTAAVPQVSFGVPLIVGPTNPGWSDAARTYSAPADLLADGYTTTSPEYLYALAMFSQSLTPTNFVVGRRVAPSPTQTDTIKVTTLQSGAYSITVNASVITYTASGSDTQQSILTALGSSIAGQNPATSVVTGTGTSAVLTVTATGSNTITYTAVDAKLARASVTPTPALAVDLANIAAANGTWYGLVVAGATDADNAAAAAWTEANKKLFIALSGTSAIGATGTSDALSTLKGLAYKRTALLFSPANPTSGAEAAWMGGQLPATPGSNTWAYKSLVGITPDNLSANQINTVIGNPQSGVPGKNGNIYTVVGGVPLTQQGIAVGGQYLDITIGLDWLQATMQNAIFTALVTANKIPYTNEGVGVLLSAVRSAIDQGVANGLIDGTTAIVVTAPNVLSATVARRAARIAPDITFSCRLQGAVQAVHVAGTVTV